MSTAPAKKSTAAKESAAAKTTVTTTSSRPSAPSAAADDPGSTGDPLHPDTGTRDKVAAGNPEADANLTGDAPAKSGKKVKPQDAQHEKEIRRAQSLGISGADSMKREELQAELGRPENFSSLLDRDTTHFQNVHYGVIDNKLEIGSGSGNVRQLAGLAALEAVGANVQSSTGWAGNEDGVKAFQAAHDLEETGAIDRATWDAITDDLFPS